MKLYTFAMCVWRADVVRMVARAGRCCLGLLAVFFLASCGPAWEGHPISPLTHLNDVGPAYTGNPELRDNSQRVHCIELPTGALNCMGPLP